MKVLVCGGRTFTQRSYMFGVLDALNIFHSFTHLIHGDARGADTLADGWARSRDIPVSAFPAAWDEQGLSAGHRRNAAMLREKPELVVAFDGGSGTADMVRRSRRAGVKVLEFNL